MTAPTRQRIAILGGGAAALSAAWELSRPELRDRYELTVYQVGWRLGGKGASGRRGPEQRIEEHGLHIWLGYYDNAFRVMRECYEELDRPASHPMRTVWDAFQKASLVGTEDLTDRGWQHWITLFPENDRVPGELDDRDRDLSAWEYVKRALATSRSIFGSLTPAGRQTPGRTPLRVGTIASGATDQVRSFSDHGLWTSLLDGIEAVSREASRNLNGREFFALDAALELADAMSPDARDHSDPELRLLVSLVDAFFSGAKTALWRAIESTDETRRLFQVADLLHVNIRGVVEDGLLTDPRGFLGVDELEYREWLRSHGASEETLDSGVLRGLYDLAFAYEDGDAGRPRFAAGQALQCWSRTFFNYKGAFFWKMRAGMGDVIFAPLYEALVARGVRFEFFHRVTQLRLAPDSDTVASILLERQVETRTRDRHYEPLVDVKGVPSWPAEPLWEQIANAEQLRRHDLESSWSAWTGTPVELRAGEDFDAVLFGISLGAVPQLCAELMQRSHRWRRMVENVKTVQTQALQLWLTADTEELGWDWGPVTLDGYVKPFDTWSEMNQVLPFEIWNRDPPRSLAYFCSVLPDADRIPGFDDHDFPRREFDRVKDSARRFLQQHIGQLWPNAARAYPEDFRWELLHGATEAAGPERLDSQYWRANVEPSDRYVQSVPGSGKYRIKTDETGFDNLYIAGDWIDLGYNAGCVEAAVISGLLAANAISGSPPIEEIVGRYPLHP